MKTLLLICTASVAVMHFHQDLSTIYWAALACFSACALAAAVRLDRGSR